MNRPPAASRGCRGLSKLPARLVLILALTATVLTSFSLSPPAGATDLRFPSFDYGDIRRFAVAIASIESGADPEAAFQKYLDGAGAGLATWSTRYDISAQKYATAYENYPRFLAYLGGLEPALRALEAGISADLVRLRDLVGDAMEHETLSILPTYYFVSPMGGGGSAEATGSLVAVDYFGRNADAPLGEFAEKGFFPAGKQLMQPLDTLSFVAAHEMVHWYQTLLQGEIDYIRLYVEEGADTLLARAVREGGADLLARLASGASTADQLAYGDAHEEALWREFRKHADAPSADHPGWFHGRNPAFPDAPWQIGYYVGMRMCEAYYDAADDKQEALRVLLLADSREQYGQIMAAYDAHWADSK